MQLKSSIRVQPSTAPPVCLRHRLSAEVPPPILRKVSARIFSSPIRRSKAHHHQLMYNSKCPFFPPNSTQISPLPADRTPHPVTATELCPSHPQIGKKKRTRSGLPEIYQTAVFASGSAIRTQVQLPYSLVMAIRP